MLSTGNPVIDQGRTSEHISSLAMIGFSTLIVIIIIVVFRRRCPSQKCKYLAQCSVMSCYGMEEYNLEIFINNKIIRANKGKSCETARTRKQEV